MAADAIAAHLLAAAFAQVDRVACHLSMGTEPGTGPLITGLLKRGVEVIVPVTRPRTTRSTGWSSTRPHPLRLSSIGVPEPDGPRLGPEALDGRRLGHRPGDGRRPRRPPARSRRRLLRPRAGAGARRPICAVVHANELLESVPHEAHDVPVQMAVTEAGLFRVPTG